MASRCAPRPARRARGNRLPRHANPCLRLLAGRARTPAGGLRGQSFWIRSSPRYHSVFVWPRSRVITVAPLPPEKCAYALARYSRSPDSIQKSIEWVRTHDSQKFLESFYFQYGHASIADLGHVVLCFEGISELAATEVEDEQLWDGQARSSRYQDFSKIGFRGSAGISGHGAALYSAAAKKLLAGYQPGSRDRCASF